MNRDAILSRLREHPASNAWAIQDLTYFPERSKMFALYEDDPAKFSYLLWSGHPSVDADQPTIILGGNPRYADSLMQHLPSMPFVIRETSAEFLPVIEKSAPAGAKTFHEQRMELHKNEFRPRTSNRARRLIESDAEALALFHGAPPQAARGFTHWIRGARALIGIFDRQELVAIGSSFCTIPECWTLVSIETKTTYRRQGLGSEITSRLCEMALEQAPRVSLTVVQTNSAAIGLYEKLGFQKREERVWVDCGTGAKP